MLIKQKEMSIYQTIVYEHLKAIILNCDEFEGMLINGMHYHFEKDRVSERVYDAYLQLTDKQTVEVVFLFSKYILKNEK